MAGTGGTWLSSLIGMLPGAFVLPLNSRVSERRRALVEDPAPVLLLLVIEAVAGIEWVMVVVGGYLSYRAEYVAVLRSRREAVEQNEAVFKWMSSYFRCGGMDCND